MNKLPLVIENLILDYKYQLELSEHKEKFKPTIKLMLDEIVEYQNPQDMKRMWGGRVIFHGRLTSWKYPSGQRRWSRDMEYRNNPILFEQCERRIICDDCGLNTNIGNYSQEVYPNAMSCCNEDLECDLWYCGCDEDRECCDCELED